MLTLVYPMLDPVIFSVGPLSIRWYALAYVAGFVLGWLYTQYLARQNPTGPSAKLYDDYLTWAVIGVVLGGRIGYILFYQFPYYMREPLEMLKIWHGGMSFHGGMLGVIAATILFTRRNKVGFFHFIDLVACATPIGLFFGRIANFINGELYGRVTDVPWAMVFPRGGDLPRHPSQLYEGALEGAVLFFLLAWLVRKPWVRARHGFLSGVFLTGYASFRFLVEFCREPDIQLGYLIGGLTMGQLLCLPMIFYGLYLIYSSKKEAPREQA